MVILSLGLISSAQADLADGLVGYWPFDGDSLDASGQGRDGVPSRDIVYVEGVQGQAMDCDGQFGAGVKKMSQP